MKIRYFGWTDKGSVRSQNEDSMLLGPAVFNNTDSGGASAVGSVEPGCDFIAFAVADGMGGHACGEVASGLTLRKFSEYLTSRVSAEALEMSLRQTIAGIHEEVLAFGKQQGNPNMGTTLCGCVLNRSKFAVFNAGDSRFYRMRSQYLEQISKDHSLSEMLGGDVPKNIITSCIGGGSVNITIDIFDLSGRVKAGDLFLICSDGLHGALTVDDIEEIMNRNRSGLESTAKALVAAAIEKGSDDNVTCVLCECAEL